MSQIPSRFSRPPRVDIHVAAKQRLIYIVRDGGFDYWTNCLGDGTKECIRIHDGFPSNGASVPRFFWRAFPPAGPYLGAAIVHDFLCDSHLCSSRLAADIFDEAMIDLGVPWRTRWPMVKAVRWFGPRF